MEPLKPKPKKTQNTIQHLDLTSSLNNYFICNNCGKQYKHKINLYTHIPLCTFDDDRAYVVCKWCNLEFKNRGNLVGHAMRMHGDSSYRSSVKSTTRFNCDVCHRAYMSQWQLKYHIRKQHFNLTAHAPYCELKKVNQVWFEKVMNSNIVVEMKKTGENTLVMRKLDSTTAIKVHETYRQTIDLRNVYPIGRSSEQIQCHLCHKTYVKRDFKKHMDETHHNIVKHRCNNCNTNFKRVYAFLKHVCKNKRKVKGIKNCNSDIRIASVESLSVPSPYSD